MTKDRIPVVLTTTSDHLSLAAEAILKRFPKGARPDKNVILNDIAAALSPGKNWGGLLAEAREGTAAAEPVAPPRPTLRFVRRLPLNTGTSVGALVRTVEDRDGVVSQSPLLEDEHMRAIAESLEGRTILGLALSIQESFGGGFDTDPVPYLLLEAPGGGVSAWAAHGDDLPPALARAVFATVQRAWFTNWHEFLPSEGIEQATVVLGPSRGAAIVPVAALAVLRAGRSVEPLEGAAVRLLVPAGGAEASSDLAILARLVEAALPALASEEGETREPVGPVRLRIGGPERRQGLWRPLEEVIPGPPWTSDHIVQTPDGRWVTDPEALDQATPSTLASVLGEALAFVMDYHGVPAETPLCIDGLGEDPVPGGRRTRRVGQDWRIVGWPDGRPHEWRLETEEEHALLRRRLEAWLEAERTEVVPTEALPPTALRVLGPRATRRNDRHWDRAIGIFTAWPEASSGGPGNKGRRLEAGARPGCGNLIPTALPLTLAQARVATERMTSSCTNNA